MFARGKGGDIFFFLIELLAVVELDVIIWHGSLFMQTFVTGFVVNTCR
jgi:hypothetical protein